MGEFDPFSKEPWDDKEFGEAYELLNEGEAGALDRLLKHLPRFIKTGVIGGAIVWAAFLAKNKLAQPVAIETGFGQDGETALITSTPEQPSIFDVTHTPVATPTVTTVQKSPIPGSEAPSSATPAVSQPVEGVNPETLPTATSTSDSNAIVWETLATPTPNGASWDTEQYGSPPIAEDIYESCNNPEYPMFVMPLDAARDPYRYREVARSLTFDGSMRIDINESITDPSIRAMGVTFVQMDMETHTISAGSGGIVKVRQPDGSFKYNFATVEHVVDPHSDGNMLNMAIIPGLGAVTFCPQNATELGKGASASGGEDNFTLIPINGVPEILLSQQEAFATIDIPELDLNKNPLQIDISNGVKFWDSWHGEIVNLNVTEYDPENGIFIVKLSQDPDQRGREVAACKQNSGSMIITDSGEVVGTLSSAPVDMSQEFSRQNSEYANGDIFFAVFCASPDQQIQIAPVGPNNGVPN